jgi:DNA-binding CsgD family transcriptional regulator
MTVFATPEGHRCLGVLLEGKVTTALQEDAVVGLAFDLLHALTRKTSGGDVMAQCGAVLAPLGVDGLYAVEFRGDEGEEDGLPCVLGTWNRRGEDTFDDKFLATDLLRRRLGQLPGPVNAEMLREVAANDERRAAIDAFMSQNGFADVLALPVVKHGTIAGAIGLGVRDANMGKAAAVVMAVVAQHVFDVLKGIARVRSTSCRQLQHMLTPREIECLQLCADGLSSWKIGRELAITERTATAHLASCMTKLVAETRMHAMAEGIRRGFIR